MEGVTAKSADRKKNCCKKKKKGEEVVHPGRGVDFLLEVEGERRHQGVILFAAARQAGLLNLHKGKARGTPIPPLSLLAKRTFQD